MDQHLLDLRHKLHGSICWILYHGQYESWQAMEWNVEEEIKASIAVGGAFAAVIVGLLQW